MPEVSSALQRLIERAREEGWHAVVGCVVNGVFVDALLRTPGDRLLVVQEKAWDDVRRQTVVAKATREAEMLHQVLASDAEFFLVPASERTDSSRGIVDLAGLASELTRASEAEVYEPTLSSPRPRPVALDASGHPAIFAAMPFEARFEDTFFLGIAGAADDVGAACIRVDEEVFTTPIVDRIHARIREAALVVADVSGNNANVLYEIGYAHGVGRPTLLISSDAATGAPFDVRGWTIVNYSLGQVHSLRTRLAAAFRSILSESRVGRSHAEMPKRS